MVLKELVSLLSPPIPNLIIRMALFRLIRTLVLACGMTLGLLLRPLSQTLLFLGAAVPIQLTGMTTLLLLLLVTTKSLASMQIITLCPQRVGLVRLPLRLSVSLTKTIPVLRLWVLSLMSALLVPTEA